MRGHKNGETKVVTYCFTILMPKTKFDQTQGFQECAAA